MFQIPACIQGRGVHTHSATGPMWPREPSVMYNGTSDWWSPMIVIVKGSPPVDWRCRAGGCFRAHRGRGDFCAGSFAQGNILHAGYSTPVKKIKNQWGKFCTSQIWGALEGKGSCESEPQRHTIQQSSRQ